MALPLILLSSKFTKRIFMPIYSNDLQPLPFFSIGDAKINLAGKEHVNAVD